jgi:multidrug efflux pump subunit AcrA (membrane-fusion protein)
MNKTLSRTLLSIAAILAIGALIIINPLGFISEPETSDVTLPRDTATVSLGDLSRTVEADGQVVFATEAVVIHPGSGTITALASQESVAASGDMLYEVDDDPTVLLYGTIPVYRALSVDDVGPDVEQLEAALVALGYDQLGDMTVDDTFTDYTASVVRGWQADLGVSETGRVELGAVIFAPGDVLVGAHATTVGTQINNSPVMSLSSQVRQVEFDVAVADLDSISVGTTVSARLPDRSNVDAVVTSLVSGESTWSAIASVASSQSLTRAGVVPVTVRWTEDLATGVLTVPAVSLTRLDDGTYNLEVIQADGSTSFVPVEVGVKSGATVQVNTELPEGTQVISP